MRRSSTRHGSMGFGNLKNSVWLLGILVLLSLPAQPIYAFTVVLIKSQGLAPYDRAVEGFKRTTSDRVIEFTLIGEDAAENDPAVNKIDRIRPDAILAVGLKAARLAKSKLAHYPIVYAMVINPEKYRLNGRRIYGVPMEVSPSQQFKLLKRVIPGLHNIGVLYDPKISGEMVVNAVTAARDLGLSLETEAVRTAREVPNAVRQMKGKVDAIWMVPDSTVYSEESLPFIFTFAFEEGLPFMASSESFVEAGALLSLSPDYEDIGRRASLKIDDILSGRVQNLKQTIRYRLVLNLRTAKKIHLKIPRELLNESSEVYQ